MSSKLLKVLYNNTMNAWDYYKVELAEKQRAKIWTLFWIGGDASVPTSPERWEGYLHDHGNGVRLVLDDTEVELNYSQFHALRLLVTQYDEESFVVESYKLERE